MTSFYRLKEDATCPCGRASFVVANLFRAGTRYQPSTPKRGIKDNLMPSFLPPFPAGGPGLYLTTYTATCQACAAGKGFLPAPSAKRRGGNTELTVRYEGTSVIVTVK
jgi:hypothetical protein